MFLVSQHVNFGDRFGDVIFKKEGEQLKNYLVFEVNQDEYARYRKIMETEPFIIFCSASDHQQFL